MNTKQKSSFHNAKPIILITACVLFLLWVLHPYMHNKTDLMPHNYYRFGVECLKHFEAATNDHGYKLMNTYAKRISKVKDMVLIQAKYPDNQNQLQIKCVYDDASIKYLGVNGEKVDLENTTHIN